MVLQPKSNLGGHPLILCKPWLATIDSYIDCISKDMTISHGKSTKKITLHPLSKPISDQETPLWIGNGDNDDEDFQ
jgi:hypothetical protein